MASVKIKTLCDVLNKMRIQHTSIRTRTHYEPPKFRPPYWYMPKERVMTEEMLSQENKDFIDEVKQDKLSMSKVLESPLTNVDLQPTPQWNPRIRRVGLIARKIGNYPMWTKDGKKVQTTLVQVADTHVIKYIPPTDFAPMVQKSVKWRERHQLGCLLVGSETVDPSTVTKDYSGIFSQVGMLPKKYLYRFIISPQAALPTGTPLFATHFRVGDYLDVRAKTIDRDFQGVMKRWGFKGMPATHGVTKTHRRPGNIGSGGEKARVWPGTKMPGHMGNRWRILRGVQVLRINTKHNVLWLKGVGIPGETGAMCYLYDTILPLRRTKNAPPFPTHPPSDNLPLEYYDETIHAFEEPTITFQEV